MKLTKRANIMIVEMETKMEKNIMSQKRKIGFSLGILMIAIYAIAFLISWLLYKFNLDYLTDNIWIEYGINAISTYFVGFIVLRLFLRKVEEVPKAPKVKLDAKKILFYMFVTISVGLFMSMFTDRITTLINAALNIEIADRVVDLIQKSNPMALIIFVAILGPICEELIFRGYLLKKLRVYGDKTAVIYTAIAFGLFHSNVSQIVFAAAVGLVLAYVMVKTNNIKYPIIMHIAMNSISTITTTLIYYNLNALVAIISLLIIVLVIASAIILPLKASKCKLDITDEGKYDKTKLYKNIGYIFSVIIVVIITAIGSINI